MVTISTQQTKNEATERKQKLEELKTASDSWLSYNRKILKAEVEFLKAVQSKRTDKKTSDQTASNIRPLFIKSLRDFLGS